MHYHDALKTAVTTFMLPEHEVTGDPTPINMDELRHMPYHSIRIVEPFVFSPAVAQKILRRADIDLNVTKKPRHGLDSTVFYLAGDRVRYSGKITNDDGRAIYYSDEDGKDLDSVGWDWPVHSQGKNTSALIILRRLLAALNDRSTRYQEQVPLNRQQRRAEGVAKEHRSYLVVRPRDEGYATATKSTEILKRLKALHTVRGHMRHLSSGHIVPVRAHTRGSIGTAVQAKDYVIS